MEKDSCKDVIFKFAPLKFHKIAQMVEKVICKFFYKGSWVQFLVKDGFSLIEKNNFWRWILDRIWITMLKHTYQIYFNMGN